MATLNTLRTKGGWIITIVIGVSLVAFLLGDLAGNNSIFGRKINVGEVDGTTISYEEYYKEVEYLTNVNKIMRGSEAIDQQTQTGLYNYAWEMLFNKYAVEPGYKNLGIEVSESEMFERVYGENISPVLMSSGFFTNTSTGMYDKTLLRNFITNLSYDQSGQLRVIWNYLQDQVENEALMGKFLSLTGNMVYVTDLEAELAEKRANAYYTANYVTQPYSSVPDSLVRVTNGDVKKYYDTHKNYFKQVAARDVEYVVFDVLPSEQDYLDAQASADNLAAEFAASDNPMQFVTLNSQSPADPMYYSREQLAPDMASFAFGSDKDKVFGPVLASDVYSMARVNDSKMMPDSVGIRQLFMLPGTTIADSLVTVLNNGGSFEMIAAAHAADVSMNDMGVIPSAFIPNEIMDEILATPKDKVFKMENANGIMIIDAYRRGTNVPMVQIATVVYNVEPSAATQQEAYSKTSGFVTAVSGSYDNFNKVINENVYSKRVVRIYSTDDAVSGFENAKELSRWAFNAKEGEVSPIMEIDGHYMIAAVSGVKEDGFTPMNQAVADITGAVMNEKRAEYLVRQMNGASSLEELAGKFGTTVGEVVDLNFNSYYNPPIGTEPVVCGAASGLPEGKVSRPVTGNSGVYVIQVTSTSVDENTTAAQERIRIEAVEGGNSAGRAMEAVHTLSNVKDSRIKYF